MYFRIMHRHTNIISASDEMHHCASITQAPNEQFLLTFYHGNECTDDQRTVLQLRDKSGALQDHLELANKTGNSIVWTYKDKCYIIYSYFTDADEEGRGVSIPKPVMRWMFCNNYLAEVVVENGIKIKNVRLISGAHGQLVRNQPIPYGDKMLIPMYREMDPRCFIWEFDGDSMSKLSDFGDIEAESGSDLSYSYLGEGVAIQPTLIVKENRIHAYCRNVCRPLNGRDKTTMWHAESSDAKSWSKLKSIDLPNHNNSLSAIDYLGKEFLVFNPDRSRSRMVLLDTNSRRGTSIEVPMYGRRNAYSYPNCLVDSSNDLHIVHTNCQRIAWHIMNKNFIEGVFNISF